MNSLPLPMVGWVMPVTFTQFQDNPLQLTCEIRGGSSPKVKGTEAPEFMVLVFSNRSSVNHTDPQPMPLRWVGLKVVEHCSNIDIPLFRLDKSTC
jgi:hypothetical protein